MPKLSLNQFGEERSIWRLITKGTFSIRSFNKLMACEGGNPSLIIQESIAPPTIIFFAWEALCKKEVTLDNMCRKSHLLVDKCILYLVNKEKVDHLLLHYETLLIL